MRGLFFIAVMVISFPAVSAEFQCSVDLKGEAVENPVTFTGPSTVTDATDGAERDGLHYSCERQPIYPSGFIMLDDGPTFGEIGNSGNFIFPVIFCGADEEDDENYIQMYIGNKDKNIYAVVNSRKENQEILDCKEKRTRP